MVEISPGTPSVPKSIRNYEKKIMLGTSDTWSMSCSTQRIILKIVGFVVSKFPHPSVKIDVEGWLSKVVSVR